MYSKESVEYAIKTNELEGAVYTEDDKKFLFSVADGKITIEEALQKTIEKYKEEE